MIKKYDDNYIDLSKVAAVGNIEEYYGTCAFAIIISGQMIHISDTNKERLDALRERLVKDWKEVENARD